MNKEVVMFARVVCTLSLVGSLAFYSTSFSLAAELSSEPILTVDTGQHTQAIQQMVTDKTGRWLVTASSDKTIRVWNTSSGQLLNTVRVPANIGNEGEIRTVALSPDGQVIAAGGDTGRDWDKSYSIYLFDRNSGKMIRRISSIPQGIRMLKFSADGEKLAVATYHKSTMYLFSVFDGKLISKDDSCSDGVISFDFANNSKMVTTCSDGFIRLFQLGGKSPMSLVKKKTIGSKAKHNLDIPSQARFSPDGQFIAVNFFSKEEDSNKLSLRYGIHVLNVKDLSVAFTPEIIGGTNHVFSGVDWSPDGESLYGWANKESYIWHGNGAGRATIFDAGSISLAQPIPLPKGFIAFSDFSTWGVKSSIGDNQFFHPPSVLEMPFHYQIIHSGWENVLNSGVLSLSKDGSRLSFGDGKYQLNIDILKRTYIPSASESEKYFEPLSKVSGLEISEGITGNVLFDGKPISLHDDLGVISVALMPSGEGFFKSGISSTSASYLRAYTKAAVLLWERELRETAKALNVSQDGRWIVATYADGTIRWHRSTDGMEQLAFFPHADKKRWILWTPSGYYDTSPGAEDLIGWHINRGKNQAAVFFPASRFRDKHYRPDVISMLFETRDESQAIRLANQIIGKHSQEPKVVNNLPPTVELRSPSEIESDQPQLVLKYLTHSSSHAPVTGIRVRVNGQAVSEERALRLNFDSGDQRVQVTIPKQDSEIQLFAENINGISVPATIRVKWTGKTDSANFHIKPKLYVLAVGVANYASKDIGKLTFSAKDAKDFVSAMKLQTQLYREIDVRLLTDDDATRDNVVDGLEWLQKQVTQHDVGMLFLAGHGVNDTTAGYYYLPVNADPDKLKRTGVSMEDIRGTLANISGKAVFFIDTCHAGNVLGSGRRGMNDLNGVINELASAENGVVVFSSSTGRQYSLENEMWGNGAFTKAVIEGMSGGADFKKTGRITHKMLDLFVSERVKVLTNGQQSPVTQAPGGVPDFPVASSLN